jgi:hypothetical protein
MFYCTSIMREAKVEQAELVSVSVMLEQVRIPDTTIQHIQQHLTEKEVDMAKYSIRAATDKPLEDHQSVPTLFVNM